MRKVWRRMLQRGVCPGQVLLVQHTPNTHAARTSARMGSAPAIALETCPLLPAIMTGRVVPRKAARGTTREGPRET